MLNLTLRQLKIAELISQRENVSEQGANISEQGITVADVGCDHGRLGAYLIQTGKAECVICTDISKPSLNKAANLAKRLNIQDKMQLRVGDGLNPIARGEVQAIVIAGMSGVTIADIIANGEIFKDAQYILQPMSETYRLRKRLSDMGFGIEDEAVVREHRGRERFYEIIKCRWTGDKTVLDEKYLYIPQAPLMRKDEDMLPFLEWKATVMKKALGSASLSKGQEQDSEYMDEKAQDTGVGRIRKQLELYQEGLEWLR